ANEGAFDVGPTHRIQVFAVFAGFHGDLREKHHVFGELGELFHQVEAIGADCIELVEAAQVVLLARQAKVGLGNRVEIVVGERDEAKSETAQRNNLFNHALVTPQARLLPVGAPDAAKGAMLRASAGSLHGGPHVLVGPHQVPAGGQEI